jgi:hypothetical protein
MNGVPLAGGHRDVESQGHDEDQAVGVAELGVLDAEAARLEVREHRFDAPSGRILKGSQVAGFFGHRDDPGLDVPRIVDDADVGSRPPAGQLNVFQVVGPVPARSSSCRCRRTPRGCSSGAGDAALLAPADQIGGAVEAQQPDLGLPGQPRGDRVEQPLLSVEPDRASSTRQASGKARSPQRSASISTWWRSDILD